MCYQTEIEHINENKVDSTGSVFLIGIGPLTFNVKTFFPVFFPAIWDTIFHYSLQYNPSTVNSALLSVNYPVHMHCFFPSLTVVSLSQCHSLMVSYPCTGSVGSSSSLSLCAGHNLFAKGFKVGRRQTLILLLYPGLGPATENLKKKKIFLEKSQKIIFFLEKSQNIYFFSPNPEKSGRRIRKPSN